MPRKILVFGISGELGSRFAHLALQAGHKVYGVSRGRNVRPGADVSGAEIFTGDKLDREFLADLAKRIQPDVILDTIPSVAMLDNIREFVPLQGLPADETHPWREPNEVNFHGKIANDKHALELFDKYKFPVTIFRPTNIIGDGRVPLDLYGGRDIEFFRALKKSEPLTLPDCREVLLQSGCNWDLSRAMFLALNADSKDIAGEIIVISCRQAIRIKDYLKFAMEYLNSHSEITWMDADDFQAQHPEHTGLRFLREHMCFNISKAEALLGYKPEYTAREGLLRALEWCEKSGLL